MSINKKKIRREVMLNGVKVWVTADTEQEYVNKVLQLSGTANKASGEKHPFKAYAEKWFEIFSKPNVANVTALTYERQLNNHILPVLGDLNVEDVTAADVQRIFTEWPRTRSRRRRTKSRSFSTRSSKWRLMTL